MTLSQEWAVLNLKRYAADAFAELHRIGPRNWDKVDRETATLAGRAITCADEIRDAPNDDAQNVRVAMLAEFALDLLRLSWLEDYDAPRFASVSPRLLKKTVDALAGR